MTVIKSITAKANELLNHAKVNTWPIQNIFYSAYLVDQISLQLVRHVTERIVDSHERLNMVRGDILMTTIIFKLLSSKRKEGCSV